MGLLAKVEGVVGDLKRGLEVAQQRIDGLELRQLGAALATAGNSGGRGRRQ